MHCIFLCELWCLVKLVVFALSLVHSIFYFKVEIVQVYHILYIQMCSFSHTAISKQLPTHLISYLLSGSAFT
jgi:hypothetical protein